MEHHFTEVEEIQVALIDGDVGDALAPATWMAEHYGEVEYPEAWRPYVHHMREAAQKIGSGVELAEASAAFVEMGQACAACHVAFRGPEVEVGEPPSVGASTDTRADMARHQWAIDTMWKGLSGPSRGAWIAGAEALAEAPLIPAELGSGRSVPDEIEEAAARVHELGNVARDLPEVSGIPGQIYGQLLTTCETCHGALKRE